MADITFNCSECKQPLVVDSASAGLEFQCPTCSRPITAPQQPLRTIQTSGKNMRTIQILIVCLTVLVGLVIWKSWNRTVTVTMADGTRIEVNVSALESVLKQDKTTIPGAKSVADVVTRMHAIDTSDCPNDFRAAYLAHIHAWESMAEVEQQALAFNADREGSGDMVEGFIRGFLGDPFGKAGEIRGEQSQLQRNYQAARQELKQTYDTVQEIAVAYGARLPTN